MACSTRSIGMGVFFVIWVLAGAGKIFWCEWFSSGFLWVGIYNRETGEAHEKSGAFLDRAPPCLKPDRPKEGF